jgi:hypothetical protein
MRLAAWARAKKMKLIEEDAPAPGPVRVVVTFPEDASQTVLLMEDLERSLARADAALLAKAQFVRDGSVGGRASGQVRRKKASAKPKPQKPTKWHENEEIKTEIRRLLKKRHSKTRIGQHVSDRFRDTVKGLPGEDRIRKCIGTVDDPLVIGKKL